MAANNRRQIVVDSRLPVGENTSITDPTHPRNLTLLAANTEAQAAADQRYDINPPPRVEGFLTMAAFYSQKTPFRRLPLPVNLVLLVALFAVVLHVKQSILKGLLAMAIIFVLHSVVTQFETLQCAPHTPTQSAPPQ